MSANLFDKPTGTGRVAEIIRRSQEQQEKQRIGKGAGFLRRVTTGGTVFREKPFQRVKSLEETDTGVWV